VAAIAAPYHFPSVFVESYVLIFGARAAKYLATHSTVVSAQKESELLVAIPAVERLVIGYPLGLLAFVAENILTCFYIVNVKHN